MTVKKRKMRITGKSELNLSGHDQSKNCAAISSLCVAHLAAFTPDAQGFAQLKEGELTPNQDHHASSRCTVGLDVANIMLQL